MAEKRSKLRIIYDILRVISDHENNIKLTPLIRKTNLSTAGFNDYYQELLKKEFIREVYAKKGKYITLTDKGFLYLNKYKLILKFIEEFEL